MQPPRRSRRWKTTTQFIIVPSHVSLASLKPNRVITKHLSTVPSSLAFRQAPASTTRPLILCVLSRAMPLHSRPSSTSDKVTHDHEWNAPGVSPNRKREAAVDERFLARGSGLDTSRRCCVRLESQHARRQDRLLRRIERDVAIFLVERSPSSSNTEERRGKTVHTSQ